MSEKELCPICDLLSSSLYNSDICPNGCPQELRYEVAAIRRRTADDKLKSDLEVAVTRAVKAELKSGLLEWRIEMFKYYGAAALAYLNGDGDEEAP